MADCASRRRRRALLLALCLPALATLAAAYEPADVVLHQPGTLPLVLTAPHDGDLPLGMTPVRSQGARVRDIGTAALTEQVAQRLQARLGQRPCVVVARFSRRFLDANRPEADALESDSALPAYRAYHAAVADCVAQARARHPQGALLVDVHGQGQASDTLFRGTRAGLTARSLLARHGPAALQGPQSLIGLLAAKGYTVHPAVGAASLAEDPRFAGGYTVATYGSQQAGGIDAIQLEFGLQQRQSPQLADDLADALAGFLRAHGYLP